MRFTPLRDIIRGRLTGRLDIRARIAAAALPASIEALILRVVRRTRLWRLEKVDVSDELIAHFTDGLASGASAEELIRNFGDARSAAKLIRRAKHRNRSPLWQLVKWMRRALIVMMALYAIVLIRFFTGSAHIGIDYLAQLNASTVATPQDLRAWPIYREAILSLDLQDLGSMVAKRAGSAREKRDAFKRRVDSVPGDQNWADTASWLDANQSAIALVAAAAAKPQLGFVLGPGGTAHDEALGWDYPANERELHPDRQFNVLDDSLITLRLPYLQSLRNLAQVLAADTRLARERGDGTRALRNLAGLRGIAEHLRTNFIIDQSTSMGIDHMMLDESESALCERPDLLTDDQLIAFAHRLGDVGGDTAATVIDYSGERAFFYDMVQRLYTDDGHGDGRLTHDAAAVLPLLNSWDQGNQLAGAQRAARLGFGSVADARREVVEEYNRLLDHMAAQSARPMRDVIASGVDKLLSRRKQEIQQSPLWATRMLPVLAMTPEFTWSQETAERLLGERDGIQVGIALELYRRRHDGQYPKTLEALVPRFLPRVPEDRIAGGPLHYRVVGGKAVVYSVGSDRDDDGGRAWAEEPAKAAQWRTDHLKPSELVDADWIVFDGRPQTKPPAP